jgi:ubiquinone/menaquinone biosynthesis C-methylase UbiE
MIKNYAPYIRTHKERSMKLGKIEKWFINRETHSRQVIKKADRLIDMIDIKQVMDFLEIGCGSGAVSRLISERYGINVTGTDIDEDQIKIAKDLGKDIKNVTFLIADAAGLPFSDKSFDAILVINVLHHISNWMDALKEMDRVLKKSGYLLISELLFTKRTEKISSTIYKKHAYGIVNKDDMDSAITKDNYSTLHFDLKKSLMWNHLEAVYRKK